MQKKKLYDEFDTGRKRGWLLLKTKKDGGNDKYIIAKELYERWLERGETGEDEFVVIRADVVGDNDIDFDFDIVVPFDVKKGTFADFMKQFKEDEENKVVLDEIKYLMIEKHNPALTYLAHGFVSFEEFEKADKEHVHPDNYGRIKRKSPGDNPWG